MKTVDLLLNHITYKQATVLKKKEYNGNTVTVGMSLV